MILDEYRVEAGGLYLKWKYLEEISDPGAAAAKQEWLDKMAEIKARHES